jgi:hypothetical protein
VPALMVLAVLLSLPGMSPTAAGAAATAAAPCLRAEDFGAVANDAGDDRDALQAAIDAAQAGPRCLDLGAGTFRATRRQTPGAASIASLRITGGLALRGAGRGATVLAMAGPGTCSGCQSFPNPTDWRLVDVTGATGVSIADLTFDGSARTATNEQTHLLQLNGPTEHVVVERADFRLPVIGPNAGGDCIRLIGSATAWVRDTTIRDVTGLDCDRSFVGLQRGLDGVVIERSTSVRVGDQAIDFEPTGGSAFACQPIIRNVLMRQLVLRRATDRGVTVSIAGDGCAVTRGVLLTDSVVDDGGVFLADTQDVTLSGLTLRGLPTNAVPTVRASKRLVNFRILDSVIERAAAGPDPSLALSINGQNGANPTDALLSGVTVRQAAPGPLVRTEELARLVIVGSRFDYTGPPTTAAAVHVSGRGLQAVEPPVLVDTTVTGPLAAAARVAGQVNGTPVLVRVTGP